MLPPIDFKDWINRNRNLLKPPVCNKVVYEDTEFIIGYGIALPDSLIKSAKNLKLIQLLSAGYDRMNFELLAELNISCANTCQLHTIPIMR